MSQTKSSAARARASWRRAVPVPAPTVHVGAGEPLLLIHPFTTSHDVWADVVPALAQEYEVVAATLPGHWGGTPLARGEVSLTAYADGVEALLDELGWETAHIAGNSIGGWLAFEMARRGRARSVTAIAPAGAWTRWSRNQVEIGLRFLAIYPFALLGHALGDHVTSLGPVTSAALKIVSHRPARVARERADNFLRASTHCASFLPFLISELRHGQVVDVAGLDREVPIRLVLCEHDHILPVSRFGRPYVEALPGADHVMLEDVGHIPMFEAPDLVAQVILEHVRAHSAPLAHADTA